MFPGVEESIWTWDDEAGQYYRHMFYRHEPDLNLTSPAVLKEIENIILFWLKLGVSGFRLDAASHLTTQAGNGDENKGLWILEHMRRLIEKHNPDAILLGEVDVEVEAYQDYFGNNDRLNLVLNFWLNKYFYVSLARKKRPSAAQRGEENDRPARFMLFCQLAAQSRRAGSGGHQPERQTVCPRYLRP